VHTLLDRRPQFGRQLDDLEVDVVAVAQDEGVRRVRAGR